MRVLKALVAVLLVPLIGFALAYYIQSQSGADPQHIWAAAEACARGLPRFDACTGATMTPALTVASLAAMVFGLLIIGIYWLMALICGSNRLALSLIFPPLTFLALVAIALLTLTHAGVVTLALYAADNHWLGRGHDWALIIAALLGVAAALGVGLTAIRSYGAHTVSVIGSPINTFDQPRLMLLVRNIAKKVKAELPDHVIAGMDANFFVTHANIHVLGLPHVLRGRTLYLSVPLMHGLSSAELSAVIAHELSHFANKDTAYSERFSPVYARLMSAANPTGRRPSRNPFMLPVRALTDFMVVAFHANVARVSQKRELAADAGAAAAVSPLDLANALLKVSIMSQIWHREIASFHERAFQGKFSRNLSSNFAGHLKYDLNKERVSDAVAAAMAWQVPHPTDSHPPTEDRIVAMGLDPNALLKKEVIQDRFFNQKAAADELDDLSELEEQLTHIYQRFLEHLGAGTRREIDAQEIMASVLTDLLVHMITADGVVDEREIHIAESEARKLIPSFDAVELRERCQHPGELMELDKLIELALNFLTPAGFEKLVTVLEKIAKADDVEHSSESQMLMRVRAAAELALDIEAA